MKRIYFAGSITGGRDDQALYVQIIEQLKRHRTVLTEHIADTDLTSKGNMAQGQSAEEIFTQDVNWLDSADVMVAEVTMPSLGVGYEIGRAEAKGVPVLCLFRTSSDRTLSAMIGGNAFVNVKHYAAVHELPAFFTETLAV